MSIEAKEVTRLFGTQKALDKVSFSIRQSEVVALLGPNGAGKSTMMKILTCYLPQTDGQVSVFGFDVVTQPLEVRRRVGYLPEHNPLYLEMYVREYLEFVAGIHKLGKDSRKRVDEMIGMTGLSLEAGKKIGALSKGYRQRVGLAQALIHDPSVLILDEPTSGLDPNQLEEIRMLIRNIGKEKTVLLSTHIMQEVEAVCDRVIIVNRGHVVADAPTHQVQLLNQTSRIIRVSFDKPFPVKALQKMEGVVDVILSGEASCRIFTQSERDLRPEVFHYAVKNGLVILSMDHEEQSLEQVFRQLTA
ncbi:MAG: gliding motility-associated ABC transporter ATP-binding subunit GldA [Bacteroides sp.]|jgi:ABC-2 type transport system ATP-binding protein|nr:gliding motility-associated ABC transporter ATP-binding subunit GldA [Bacteroides sp.]